MTILSGKVCIGIDVGGTNLRFALVDDHGAIIAHEKQLTDILSGRNSFQARLLAGISNLRKSGEALGRDVRAVGMGIPGLIDYSGRVLSSVNLSPLVGLNVKEFVAESVGLPVVTVNDANACAYGEKHYGSGRSFDSFLLLTLGTGVGSGLILNGNLWTGADGVAAEYGHATIEPDGIVCSCGNRGCLEQYASANALVAAAVKALDGGACGALSGIQRDSLTAEVIASAASQGDLLARSLFERAGRYLGIAGAAIANLLNLEAIILAGGMSESFDLLCEPMRREIGDRAFDLPARRMRIVKGELGDDAGILGAAALARETLTVEEQFRRE
jgi:glucokinase